METIFGLCGKKQDIYKVLESLIIVDNHCHSICCEDCPFQLMEGEGWCPLDKLGMGEKVYMEQVKEKALKRIKEYENQNSKSI